MLSAEHRELISAFADGELGVADRALAGNLLRRAEARDYLEGILRLRALVGRHARVEAPAGFAADVVKALEDLGVSRPVGRVAPVHQLPPRMLNPWLAFAAALVVTAALLVGNAMFAPAQNVPTPTLARAPVAPPPAPRPVTPGSLAAAPAPPKDKAVLAATDPRLETKGVDPSVLYLDSDTLEISLVVNRRSDAPSMQIFNDVLRVGALYGDACLDTREQADSDYRRAEARDGALVASSAFGNECVEVELDASKVAAFLESLANLSASQDYGNVSVPGYLGVAVRKNAQARAEVQRLAGDRKDVDTRKAAEVLPLEARVKAASRGAGPAGPEKLAKEMHRFADGDDIVNGCLQDCAPAPRRKLIIRLR